tara:strand:+ start:370 stop:1899 length:1530 start_codon:yes stop_codon:yes gene_type:complete
MNFDEKLNTKKKSIMILGTSSGVGKSITVTAICRILKKMGEKPVPFKGQNMSNNAWVDLEGGEMAYSQALQAFASGISPSSLMNPVLLKPNGNSTSEVIHLGKSKGITTAKNYYKNWFDSGWNVIKKSIKKILENDPYQRLVIEGAGSPVEMNLIHRDLTNLRIAKYLDADCILVADIEKGGVFAQIIGTIELMKPEERKLIKGIIINRFRGDLSLFSEGKNWIENKTKIPILGILPVLDDKLPPEDSLDLLDRKFDKDQYDLKVGVIKFPSISNFSDLHPLENEKSIQLNWVKKLENLEIFDFIILPGSKQTIKDQIFLEESGLSREIRSYSLGKGHIIGICGGLQMLGESLEDPYLKEGSKTILKNGINGIGILPLRTTFNKNKQTKQISCKSLWPCESNIDGFEIHNGKSHFIDQKKGIKLTPLFNDDNLGWYFENDNGGTTVGTYIHGILENDLWRESYINLIRTKKGLPILDKQEKNYKIKRDLIIENLALQFNKYINLSLFLT